MIMTHVQCLLALFFSSNKQRNTEFLVLKKNEDNNVDNTYGLAAARQLPSRRGKKGEKKAAKWTRTNVWPVVPI